MSDDLIEALRLQGWNDAADLIEKLERELAVAIEVVAKSGRKRGEAEAKLTKAVEALQKIASHPYSWRTLARKTLAELEGK